MAVEPIFEETTSAPSEMLDGDQYSIASFGGGYSDDKPLPQEQNNRPERKLAIYAASAGFEMVDELDHLSTRTIEPNLFFNPRFLAPAMPRLEDREIRLAVMRDGTQARSRLRLLFPFSVERAPVPFGKSYLRSWSNPFGPLGTPLIDHDDPLGVVEDFFAMLARPGLRLPKLLVLPDIRLDGPVAGVMRSVADSRSLALEVTSTFERPYLNSSLDGDTYLQSTMNRHHYRDYGRLRRRLGELGELDYVIARQPDEIRFAAERFLTLEASGWKGRKRTAMAVDRLRAAFVREAIHRLSENDFCRVHELTLKGKTIASLIVFVENGIAYTWKTAYDENYSAFSPGTLLVMDVTRTHLDDPNIVMTDSCAVPDHPVMSRLWNERTPFGTMIIGMLPDGDRAVRRTAKQIHLMGEGRNLARIVRNRVQTMLGRD